MGMEVVLCCNADTFVHSEKTEQRSSREMTPMNAPNEYFDAITGCQLAFRTARLHHIFRPSYNSTLHNTNSTSHEVSSPHAAIAKKRLPEAMPPGSCLGLFLAALLVYCSHPNATASAACLLLPSKRTSSLSFLTSFSHTSDRCSGIPAFRCSTSGASAPSWSRGRAGHPYSHACGPPFASCFISPSQKLEKSLGRHRRNWSVSLLSPTPSAYASATSATSSAATSANPATASDGLWDECSNPLVGQADRFVLFGDLHVSDATLDTCLEALAFVQKTCKRHSSVVPLPSANKVHREAAKRRCKEATTKIPSSRGKAQLTASSTPAVAVFLGDFWHSRVERHLHWGVLRPVLEFWRQWDIPTLLLPGNHDQLHYEEGRDLLQPLEIAVSQSPMILAFRRPTLINKELLFLPHIRGASKLQQIMAHAKQCQTLRAMFGHLSIRGATVNPYSEEAGALMNEGIDLEQLPNVPLYSGHIHTAQLLGKQARYVGSLYQVRRSKGEVMTWTKRRTQLLRLCWWLLHTVVAAVMLMQTSLSEAYQRKCIHTISRSANFEVVEIEESLVGPRHFPVKDPMLLPPPHALRRGDRVVLLPKTTSTAAPLPSSAEARESVVPPALGGYLADHCTATAQAELHRDSVPVARHSQASAPEMFARPKSLNSSNCIESSLRPESSWIAGTTFEKHLLGRSNELDAKQLLRLSEAYRHAGKIRSTRSMPTTNKREQAGEGGHIKHQTPTALKNACDMGYDLTLPRTSGIIFDCRVTPTASSCVVSRPEESLEERDGRKDTAPLAADKASPTTEAALDACTSSMPLSRASEAPDQPVPASVANASFLPPKIHAKSSFELLMHHGLLPVESYPPLEALRFFCSQAPKDISPAISQQILAAAENLLQEQLDGIGANAADGSHKTSAPPAAFSVGWPYAGANLVLHHARIESYGLYSNEVRFELKRRGLVLLEGKKKDSTRGKRPGELFTTNGAGKTTIMQAVVWALAGDGAAGGFTPIAGRTKVTGVVCDDVPTTPSPSDAASESLSQEEAAEEPAPSHKTEERFASVEIEGDLNGESFILRRKRWRSGRSELSLRIGGRDATGQSVVDTQRELEALFGGRLKAWSQFLYLASQGADGLLRTSEATFSMLMTLLVPLDIWTRATAAARLKQRALCKAAEALDLVAAVRERDLQRLVRKNLHGLPAFPGKSAALTNACLSEVPAGDCSEKTFPAPPNDIDEVSDAASSQWLEKTSYGDSTETQFREARRLQRLITLLRSRSAFYRSQQATLEAAEELLGPQGIQRHLLAAALRQLEEQTNIYLEEASGGLLRLDFAASKTARLSKVLSIRGSDGAFRQASTVLPLRCRCPLKSQKSQRLAAHQTLKDLRSAAQRKDHPASL
ncbi:smc domain-containing protein [Cyclospora cayetanensis]|uniref:Smc domain-containing protein n=1 Tax=Cyclospora cayetanensis TaxID=88456 RepID=A0A1D3D735_9EIME|nr:smc domain-containing protein [Cyclospora cayetanensis]